MRKIWKHHKGITGFIAVIVTAVLVVCFLLYANSSRGAVSTSESYSIETDVLSSGASSESSANYGNFDSLGQSGIGTAESTNYKTYGGFLENTGTSPEAPASLAQFKSDGTTSLSVGDWTTPGTVVLKFNMYDRDGSDVLSPQVEVRLTSESFTGANTHAGADVNFAGTTVEGVVTVEGLAPGVYHWRARIWDSYDLTSDWVSFGGNAETLMDFGVDITAPAVSVLTPTSGERIYGSSTYEVTWIVTEEGDSGLAANPVTLYYSANGGISWSLIASNEANDASYFWSVPLVASAACLISVEAEDTAGNIGADVSDTFEIFSGGWIKGTITLSGEATHADI